MKGIVLGYNAEADAIVLRADNGRRYRFKPADWRERASPRKGASVDFEPDGDHARDVYLAEPARHLEAATPAAPLAIVVDWPPARFFLARPVFSFALLVVLACLSGVYAIGDVRIPLFQVPELISRMSEALDSLIAVSGADPAPRLGAGVVRILLILLLGLYAVPVLAALTAWREFIGRPDRRLARAAGIVALVLPIGLPLLIALVVQFWVLPGIPDVGARLGRSGVTTPQQVFEVLRLYATGTVLLMATGAGLWAAAAGRISVPLDMRTIDEPPLQVAPARKSSLIDVFAPLRKRKAATKGGAASKTSDGKNAARTQAQAHRAKSAPPPADDVPAGGSEPVPFMKLGTRPVPPAPPPPASPVDQARLRQAGAEPGASEAASAGPTGAAEEVQAEAIAEDIKSALLSDAAGPASPADTELPPRGGSVWPEPAGTPPGSSPESTGEPDAAADRKR